MKHYISWGAGVNSTAIIALHILGKLEGEPEIVLANTGGELPETYEYIETVSAILKASAWTVTILSSRTHKELYVPSAAGRDLYDYLWHYRMIPSVKRRPCTYRYKMEPLKRYAAGRAAMVGMCADEKHRMRSTGWPPHLYPLRDYSRADCVELIEEAGLPQAHKTGCWFCTFQRKAGWLALYDDHPDLFQRAVELESQARRWTFYSSGVPIDQIVEGWLTERRLEEAQMVLQF